MSNSTEPFEDSAPASDAQSDQPADPSPRPGPSTRGAWNPKRRARQILSRRAIGPTLAVIVVGGLLGGAWIVGNPDGAEAQTFVAQSDHGAVFSGPAFAPAATGAPLLPIAGVTTGSLPGSPAGGGTTPDQAANLPITQPQIVKTGQLSLEVADLDKALSQAGAVVSSLGGSVSQSSRFGTGDDANATVTYRIPAARWDEALAALHKVGSKVVSEQVGTTDVTLQVVDLNARLDNLKSTESALQAIMARATAIPDVIAVEKNLSDTQGQIEELTAQRDNLANQAAMSTLAVTYQLPAKTVTVQAAQGWNLGAQIDQAGAALVRIGQGLATMGVWAVVVGLPSLIGILVLLAVLWAARRIRRSGQRTEAQPQV